MTCFLVAKRLHQDLDLATKTLLAENARKLMVAHQINNTFAVAEQAIHSMDGKDE
jgi:hypothetical protein